MALSYTIPLLLAINEHLFFDAVFLLESFYTAHSVNDSLLPGIERMARTADLNTNFRFACTTRKHVATQARDLGVVVVLRVYLWLHGYMLTFF